MTNQTFNGFPKEGLHFLLELSNNNNKEWFDEHKHIYKETIIANVPSFVTALGERLKTISPHIVYDTKTNGAGSMMRIYRDTRFSKDKTPYKTNVAFLFWEGPRKKAENPSYGLQFGTSGAGLYGGQWGFPKETLAAYREAVIDDKLGSELEAVIAGIESSGDYTVESEQYKRVPRGYDANHPRANLLLYKGLHVSASFDLDLVTNPDLVDVCFEHCNNMASLHHWLVKLDQPIR
ncbi:MAG: DUF2461 domain-containing protein [Chloroflexota bacterium]